MNFYAIYHRPDSNYCYPVNGSTMTLRLRVSKMDQMDYVKVIYGNKYTYYLKQESILMDKKYEDEYYSYYQVDVRLTDVRFVYVFLLKDSSGTYYYSEDGLTETYDFKYAYFNCFQYPYINESDIPESVTWTKDAVFYEIFIERFNQGLKNKDYLTMKWDEKPTPKSFAGGDIPGIIGKLDYLKDLGVNGIYLTPVFESISNHKYDISDYFKVDSMFGSNEDLKKLIDESHKRGIRIVMDGVFNHCSDKIREFQDVIEKGRNSRYFDWFVIHGDGIDQKNPNYETFAACSYMPKLNTSNKEVQDFIIGIGRHYVEEYHIDGWRLDVSDELSHSFWRVFRKEIKKSNPECLILGENWHDSENFLRGDQFDSIMNYSFTKTMLDYLVNDTMDALHASYRLNSLLIRNNETVNAMMMNLLDSHDTDRFYTLVHENLDVMMEGLAILFLYKGFPCLYYGTEIPMKGGYDPDNRRGMEWKNVGKNEAYLSILKSLISLRKTDVLIKGDISISSENDLLVIRRFTDKEETELIVNHSVKERCIENDGEILISNHYEKGILSGEGFLIRRYSK